MNKRLCSVLVALMATCLVRCIAQKTEYQAAATAPPNPITASEKGFYVVVSGEVVPAAEKMPEESYSFKPTRMFAVLAN
jgi:hypothetical protein